MALAHVDVLLAGELRPQCLITVEHDLGGIERIEVVREHPVLADVLELACDVLLRDREIVAPLSARQNGMELGGLGIDDVRGKCARVPSEERVRERAIAQEKPSR
mgnify:CR=1 FL=1